MNFKEIIKQEWEKEFPLGVDDQPPVFGNSIFTMYESMVERICIRVWNKAIQSCIENVQLEIDGFDEVFINKESLISLKINEQGTDTTEV